MNSSLAIESLVNHLVLQINSNSWRDGQRLPPMRTLAQQLAVSTNVLSAAIKILAERKVLTIVQRKGVFVGNRERFGAISTHSPVTERNSATRRIRQKLEHDIFSGVWFRTEDVLPLNRTLQSHYDASYPTIRVACDQLVHDGILTRKKNRYHKSDMIGITSSAAILSISFSRTGSISLFDDFLKVGLPALELGCSRSNLTLIKKGSYSDDRGRWILDHLEHTNEYFGYCLWSMGIDTELLNQIVTILAKFNKPVAIIDELGDYALPTTLNTKRFRIFTPAAELAGKRIARHLIDKGHTCCAYISCWHDQGWSQRRLHGIMQTFHEAGYPNGVKQFVTNTVAPSQFDPDPAQQTFVKQTTDDFIRLFPKIQVWASAPMNSILTSIETGEYLVGTVLWKKQFKEAIDDPSITAWVCANDSLAIMAKSFLQKTQSSAICERLSVAGFDDLPLATEYNLTSYNFAPMTIIDKAVGYLVYPKQEFFKNKTRIECEGLLIDRGVTMPNTKDSL